MIEQSSRLLKIVLGILFVMLLAGLAFLYLSQKATQKKASTVVAPPTTTPVTPMPVSDKAGSQIPTTETGNGTASTKVLSIEEASKQLKTIQDQVNAGTLTAAEGQKQMTTVGSKIAPPVLPADAKK